MEKIQKTRQSYFIKGFVMSGAAARTGKLYKNRRNTYKEKGRQGLLKKQTKT